MSPRGIDLRPPDVTRGRHFNRRLLLIVGVLLVALAVYLLLPSQGGAPRQRTWKAPTDQTRIVKDSRGLQQMKADKNHIPATPEPAAVIDTSEADKLRAENARLRELLNKVPKVEEKKPAAAPVMQHTNAEQEAKAREKERLKRQQEDRQLVVRKASAKDSEDPITQVKFPLTEFSLAPNWKIPCMTEGPVSNEVPGSFSVRVRQPVWDSATGRHVVIPQESTIGAAPRGDKVLHGDGRLGIGLQTLSFPDASHLKFGKATAGDREGHAGFSDQIDRRWGSLLASILIYPALRSGTSMVPGGSVQDPASTYGRHVASEASQQGQQVGRQFLRTEPILLTRPGFQCLILLEEPMALTRSWPLD